MEKEINGHTYLLSNENFKKGDLVACHLGVREASSKMVYHINNPIRIEWKKVLATTNPKLARKYNVKLLLVK